MPLVKKKVLKKSRPKKLYAYVDVDGFVHWNILDGHAIWDKVNKEWMVRSPDHDATSSCTRSKNIKGK